MDIVIRSGVGCNKFSLPDAAQDYAASGRAVFPCYERTKEPACTRGLHNGTTNPAAVARWWSAKAYNIGLRTGQASGCWVLDVDGEDGATNLRELVAQYGPLPAVPISRTTRGRHYWFLSDCPIQSSAGRIAAGIDVRADGGYVLVPPSIHPSGASYSWLAMLPLVAAPDWLLELARKRPAAPEIRIPPRSYGGANPYGDAALEREIELLANAAEGSRNHALNRASFSLHQLVAGGELERGEVERRLWEAAAANGLTTDPKDGPRSIARTIASGARAGMQQPRSRPNSYRAAR